MVSTAMVSSEVRGRSSGAPCITSHVLAMEAQGMCAWNTIEFQACFSGLLCKPAALLSLLDTAELALALVCVMCVAGASLCLSIRMPKGRVAAASHLPPDSSGRLPL